MQTIHKIPTIPAGVHLSAVQAAFMGELAAKSQGRKTPPFIPYGFQTLIATDLRDKGMVLLSYQSTGIRVLMTPRGTAFMGALGVA